MRFFFFLVHGDLVYDLEHRIRKVTSKVETFPYLLKRYTLGGF